MPACSAPRRPATSCLPLSLSRLRSSPVHSFRAPPSSMASTPFFVGEPGCGERGERFGLLVEANAGRRPVGCSCTHKILFRSTRVREFQRAMLAKTQLPTSHSPHSSAAAHIHDRSQPSLRKSRASDLHAIQKAGWARMPQGQAGTHRPQLVESPSPALRTRSTSADPTPPAQPPPAGQPGTAAERISQALVPGAGQHQTGSNGGDDLHPRAMSIHARACVCACPQRERSPSCAPALSACPWPLTPTPSSPPSPAYAHLHARTHSLQTTARPRTVHRHA